MQNKIKGAGIVTVSSPAHKTQAYFKVSLPGFDAGYFSTIEDAKKHLDYMVENATEYGDDDNCFEFKVVFMTEKEFEELPDFTGF